MRLVSSRRQTGPRGFTLVELVASVAVIVIAIIPLLGAAEWGINAGRTSSNTVVATHLAEEGLELIRNIRDSNTAARASEAPPVTAWDKDLNPNGTYLAYYELAVGSPSIAKICQIGVDMTNCPNAQKPLNYNSSTGVYGYNGWGTYASTGVSPYTRIITLTHIVEPSSGTNPVISPAPTYLLVKSTVTWGNNNAHSVTLYGQLYNWRP